MYDAVGGRFVSRDPIGFEGSKWCLYEYVDGMPLTRLDPTGMALIDIWNVLCGKKPNDPKLTECVAICDEVLPPGIIRHQCYALCKEMKDKAGEVSCNALVFRCKLKIKTSPKPKFWIETCLAMCEASGCGKNQAKCLDIFGLPK